MLLENGLSRETDLTCLPDPVQLKHREIDPAVVHTFPRGRLDRSQSAGDARRWEAISQVRRLVRRGSRISDWPIDVLRSPQADLQLSAPCRRDHRNRSHSARFRTGVGLRPPRPVEEERAS